MTRSRGPSSRIKNESYANNFIAALNDVTDLNTTIPGTRNDEGYIKDFTWRAASQLFVGCSLLKAMNQRKGSNIVPVTIQYGEMLSRFVGIEVPETVNRSDLQSNLFNGDIPAPGTITKWILTGEKLVKRLEPNRPTR